MITVVTFAVFSPQNVALSLDKKFYNTNITVIINYKTIHYTHLNKIVNYIDVNLFRIECEILIKLSVD